MAAVFLCRDCDKSGELEHDGEGGEEREEFREEGAFRGNDSAEAEAEAHEQCAPEEESWEAHCR